jgi:hypothetical protein
LCPPFAVAPERETRSGGGTFRGTPHPSGNLHEQYFRK